MRKLIVALAILAAGPAFAQQRPQVLDRQGSGEARPTITAPSGAIRSPQDLGDRLAKVALADLQYALALSRATGNKVSEPCWAALVDLIGKQQAELKDANGQPIAEPGHPHLATDIERMSELARMLQADSPVSIGCAPLAAATAKDLGTLIGGLLGGGSLGGLIPKLPFP